MMGTDLLIIFFGHIIGHLIKQYEEHDASPCFSQIEYGIEDSHPDERKADKGEQDDCGQRIRINCMLDFFLEASED